MAAPDSVQAPFWRPGLARVCVPAAALFFLALVTIGNLPGLAAALPVTEEAPCAHCLWTTNWNFWN